MDKVRRKPGQPFLSTLLLGAVAVAVWFWFWSQTANPTVRPAASAANSSTSAARPEPSDVGSFDAATVQSVRERGRWTIAMLVLDMAGHVVRGAAARSKGESEIVAVSDEAGTLKLDLEGTVVGDLEVRAVGFEPTQVLRANLVDGYVITLRAIPDSLTAVRVVDAASHGISGVTIELRPTPGVDPALSGRAAFSPRSDVRREAFRIIL